MHVIFHRHHNGLPSSFWCTSLHLYTVRSYIVLLTELLYTFSPGACILRIYPVLPIPLTRQTRRDTVPAGRGHSMVGHRFRHSRSILASVGHALVRSCDNLPQRATKRKWGLPISIGFQENSKSVRILHIPKMQCAGDELNSQPHTPKCQLVTTLI